MTDFDDHPDAAQLAAFLDGRLSDADRSDVESHVENCEECCEAMAKVPLDPIAARLRDVDTDVDEWSVVTEAGLPKSPPPKQAETPVALENHPRYRILEPLGHGGMGVVYKAQHRMMDRIVALKVIDGRLIDNPQMIERFRTEVKAAALLTHANIVRAYDAEQAGDLHFLVMEYVDGISLAELIQRNGPLPIDQALGVTRKVAHGLHHAFQQGMVHRDIKPQNIMVTRAGKIRILDFGLARFARERERNSAAVFENDADRQNDNAALTQVGSILGTPDYIAPEQVTDATKADTRADIYSLGCTCYFLLTGRPPFPDGNAMQKILAHRDSTPTAVTELRADISEDVAGIVSKMMARDPADRYQTPLEVATEIDRMAREIGSTDATLSGRSPQTLADSTPARSVHDDVQSPPVQIEETSSTSVSIETPLKTEDEDTARFAASQRRPQQSTFQNTSILIVCTVVIAILIPLGIMFVMGSGESPDKPNEEQGTPDPLSQGVSTEPNREAEEPVVTADGEWINLIRRADTQADAFAGSWQINNEELNVNNTVAARMLLRYSVPADYDFEVSFTRLDGQHSIALIFASGSGQATFDVDAWGENLAGIQNIQSRTIRTGERNPTRVTGYQLVNGQRYTVRLSVRRDRVEAYLDGDLVTTYHGDGSDLSLLDLWQMEGHEHGLGIGAYSAATTFHAIRVRTASP